MGLSNEELVKVRKAIIATDALAAAGKLNPAQADKFIDFVVDETVLKNNARVVRFRNETLDIDKIGVGARVAMPKSEAADPMLRRGVTTSKISLTPKEIMVPFEISDDFKEINLEGEAVTEHIVKMMARRMANDTELLYLLGDALGAAVLEGDIKGGGSTTQYIKDSYLALADGWSRLSDSGHSYDAGGGNVALGTFSGMLRQMPTKFRRNKKDLRFFMSPDLESLYAEKISGRATKKGDDAADGAVQTPFGVPIVAVPLWDLLPQVVEHVALTGTDVISLRYAPVSSEIVTTSTLDQTAETPYVEGTDYHMDYANGTIQRDAGGAIGAGATVKVTYSANPQILLTHMSNFIVGIGRDIRIEKDRDIYKGTDQYAITAKVAVQIEETDAIVKGINNGTSV